MVAFVVVEILPLILEHFSRHMEGGLFLAKALFLAIEVNGLLEQLRASSMRFCMPSSSRVRVSWLGNLEEISNTSCKLLTVDLDHSKEIVPLLCGLVPVHSGVSLQSAHFVHFSYQAFLTRFAFHC